MAPEGKSRLNLDFPLSTRERLERLREQSQAASLKDVVLQALRLYEEVMNANFEVTIREADGKERNVKFL